MAMDQRALDSAVLDLVSGMTSIRGRRVARLARRELAGFDAVRRVDHDGIPGLLASSATGRVALLLTDGRGPAATVARRRAPGGRVTTRSFDLLRDSLPPLPAAGVDPATRARAAAGLRRATS